ncbi:M10 family metallopeptidase C-terminal domain-containing protein [Microvirga aerilata]|uniref:M10 family metallopeptidase C-terminal domain-containing protein n=1 Tax=Microvirga aerilata TaxID=670292 RepID=UPI00362AF35B
MTQLDADGQTWVSDTLYFDGTVDSFGDGRSTLQWNLSPLTEVGPYTILSVYVVDGAGNERTYAPADLAAIGVPSSFTIDAFDLVTNGSRAKESIRGGSGNDKLNGGLGNDTLFGGGGKDAFVFSTKPSRSNRDNVTDFKVTDDSIWLDNAVFKKLGMGSDAAPVQLKKSFLPSTARPRTRTIT